MRKECLRPVPENQGKRDKQVLSKGVMVVSCVPLIVYAKDISHVTRGSHER